MNNFQFYGENFIQVGGTGIGTRVAPSLANIFMAAFEEDVLPKNHKQPLIFKCYIDDCFAIFSSTEDELKAWMEYLNSCHDSIKFTFENSHSSVNFLDTAVHLDHTSGKVWTDLYTKPTESHNYLHFDSAHPNHSKSSLPYSQFLHVRRICSRETDYKKHCCILKYHFLRRGYPTHILDEAYHRASSLSLCEARQIKDKNDNDEKLVLVTTFNAGDSTLKDIVFKSPPMWNNHQGTWQVITLNEL